MRHAVVLISYDQNSLKFMNSHGANWADGGMFKIENENVLLNMEFYDIFWEEDDLTENEKKQFLED
jgi:hypothetical protein